MSKTKVIAFANNKGGSGKTTTCSNVGCAMAQLGKKVLMIDGDMQLNLTISFFDEERAYEYAKSEKNIYRAVKDERDLSDYIVETGIEGLDLIPSTSLMSSIEFDLFADHHFCQFTFGSFLCVDSAHIFTLSQNRNSV